MTTSFLKAHKPLTINISSFNKPLPSRQSSLFIYEYVSVSFGPWDAPTVEQGSYYKTMTNLQEHFITGKPYTKKEAKIQAINWFERFLGGQDCTYYSLDACYDRSLLFYDRMDSIYRNSSSEDLSSKIQSLYMEYSKAFNNLKHTRSQYSLITLNWDSIAIQRHMSWLCSSVPKGRSTLLQVLK